MMINKIKNLISSSEKDTLLLVVCTSEEESEILNSSYGLIRKERNTSTVYTGDFEVKLLTPKKDEKIVPFEEVASFSCARRYNKIIVNTALLDDHKSISYLLTRCVGDLHLLS